jgi:hypothetical protein
MRRSLGHRVVVAGLGGVVEITLPSEELADLAKAAWADSIVDDVKKSAISIQLTVPDDVTATNPADIVLEYLSQTVTTSLIEYHAEHLLMLHACAVADQETGAAVVLVGPSGMGKTTMARQLAAKWAYVTDECVALDEELRVMPYPKPLSVNESGYDAKRQLAPSSLGLHPVQGMTRAQAVLLLDRDPHAVEVVVEEVPTVPAIAMLAEHTSYLSRLDRPLHRLAALLHSADGLIKVTYAEAEQVSPLVDELLQLQTGEA